MQEYKQLFLKINKITDMIKLREFQYRLLLNKVCTNDILYKWKIVNSPMCDWCNNTIQMVEHLLYECTVTNRIWEELSKRIFINCNLTKHTILNNYVHTENAHVGNVITLITKQFIFKEKYLGHVPTLAAVMNHVGYYKRIFLYNAKYSAKKEQIVSRWNPVEV